jgi:hypothetical protein
MKKKLKYSLHIEITDILITVKYYSFKYSVKINNKTIQGLYESSHTFKKNIKGFEAILKKGYAFELVLDKISSKHLKGI